MAETDQTDGAEVPEWVTELFYTGVGLAVIAVNRAQVARRSVESQVRSSDLGPGLDFVDSLLYDPDRLKRVVGTLREELSAIDERVDGIEDRLTDLVDRLEPDLPPVAGDLIRAARSVAGDNAAQVRALLGLRQRPTG